MNTFCVTVHSKLYNILYVIFGGEPRGGLVLVGGFIHERLSEAHIWLRVLSSSQVV